MQASQAFPIAGLVVVATGLVAFVPLVGAFAALSVATGLVAFVPLVGAFEDGGEKQIDTQSTIILGILLPAPVKCKKDTQRDNQKFMD